MTKVLVQVNSLALGGTQVNAVDMAAALSTHGYESVVVGPRDTLPQGPSLFDVARDRGVALEAFDREQSTLSAARTMSGLARRHGAELIHIYGSWTGRPALWGPCLLGRRPLVLTVYEMAVDPLTPRSPALIVGTKYLEEELANRREGVDLVSPPVDVDRDNQDSVSGSDFVRQLDLDDGSKLIVTVTRLDDSMKAYGVQVAMDAMDRRGARGAVLVVVGTGDAEERLRLRADEINARHGRRLIVMAGPMADPRSAYAAADIVVGMGGSAARGLSFGKPLIVTGEYGWFSTFTPQTADALFRDSFWSEEAVQDAAGQFLSCVDPLLDDQDLRARLGLFGRQFAVANFSLDAMAARVAGIYGRSLRGYGLKTWGRDVPPELHALANRCRTLLPTALGRIRKSAAKGVPDMRAEEERVSR